MYFSSSYNTEVRLVFRGDKENRLTEDTEHCICLFLHNECSVGDSCLLVVSSGKKMHLTIKF